LAALSTRSRTSRVAALDLPTSKQLMAPTPGNPRRINSLPMSLAVSPDRRWVVSLNAGYGTFESGYMQSLAVLNVRTGEVRDFPDARTLVDMKQTFFRGSRSARTAPRSMRASLPPAIRAATETRKPATASSCTGSRTAC